MEVSPEMQQRILSTQAQLQAVRAREAAAAQSKKMIDLTSRQIANEPTSGHLWQGVGRMFVRIPKAEFDKDNARRLKELDEQRAALEKKELYYSTTLQKMIESVNIE